jgi:hypothetical protein
MRLMGFSLLAVGTLGVGFMAFQSMDSDAAQKNTSFDNMDRAVVAELFTSQGCSSCPPADTVAAHLAKNDNVILISRPVTYWDRLGWKDTLAREENTELQREYARKDFANAGVYTPQMAINGHRAAIGSREYQVRDIIMSELKKSSAADLNVVKNDQGGFTLTLDGSSDGRASVTLVALDSSETVQVGRGENRGRKLTYTNVLRDENVIGTWNGGTAQYTVTAADMQIADADRYAVIVQQAGAGDIVAASYL